MPNVIPLLLLGVEAAKAVDDHRALDGEAERVSRGERECLAELTTVGTVMRPMVSGIA